MEQRIRGRGSESIARRVPRNASRVSDCCKGFIDLLTWYITPGKMSFCSLEMGLAQVVSMGRNVSPRLMVTRLLILLYLSAYF